MWVSGSRGCVSRDLLSGGALQGARQGRGSRRGCPRLTPWVWSVYSPETSCLKASHWLCGPTGVTGVCVDEAPPHWLRAFLQGRPTPAPENEEGGGGHRSLCVLKTDTEERGPRRAQEDSHHAKGRERSDVEWGGGMNGWSWTEALAGRRRKTQHTCCM